MRSIYAWFGYELPMKERFHLIKKTGFDAATLCWGNEFQHSDYRQQPLLACQAGLMVEGIHAPFLEANHIWEDTPEGQAIFECYLQCVEDCTQFKIPTMVFHASRGSDLPPASELGLERLKRLLDKAERGNVHLAVENLRAPEPIARAAYLLEQMESPHLGFCYDSGHDRAQLSPAPETDLLARFGARLMALHLHDNHGTKTGNSEEDEHLLPFEGNIDWPAIMGRVAAAGYRGATSLEVSNRGHEAQSPEEFLVLAYESAVRLEQLRVLV